MRAGRQSVRSALRAAMVGALLLVGSASTGCGLSRHVSEMQRDDSSLVFGHLDMSRARTGADWAFLKQFRGKQLGLYTRFNKGTFYRENLPNGSYAVTAIGGSRGLRLGFCLCTSPGGSETQYNLGEFGDNPTAIRVDTPGVHFIGSFAVTNVKGGVFRPATFEFGRVDSPTEVEVLEQLLPVVKGTKWETRVRARMKELGR